MLLNDLYSEAAVEEGEGGIAFALMGFAGEKDLVTGL